MKSLLKYLAIALILPALVLNSCKKDDDDTVDPAEKTKFEILSTYLTDNNMDLDDILTDWIIGAADVNGNEANYFIIDLREDADFNAGHLAGAMKSSFATLLNDAAAATKPILVVCYTGQNAGHAVVALRLSGHMDAKVLMWGMSSWGPDWDKWSTNTSSTAVGDPNWVTTATADLMQFDYPEISSTGTDGATILADQVAALLAGGFKGINAADVLASPDNYFINNYWAQADVDKYGHIAGAYRINPLTITGEEMMNLDPSKTVVTYCWTGQTSSMITAYLTVLGYDALSLKFGANGMIYDDLESHKWTAPTDNLPVETK